MFEPFQRHCSCTCVGWEREWPSDVLEEAVFELIDGEAKASDGETRETDGESMLVGGRAEFADGESKGTDGEIGLAEEGVGVDESDADDDADDGVRVVGTESQVAGVKPLEVDDAFGDVELPVLDEFDLERARRGQVGERADEIRGFLKIASKTPPGADKTRSSDHPNSPPGADKMRSPDYLKEKSETLSIMKQMSLFKINKQGIIFRLFVETDGKILILIFIDGPELNKIIHETHLATGHGNSKAILALIGKKYYSLGLGRKIIEFIRSCVECIKFKSGNTVVEKQTSLLATQSRKVLQVDLSGPLPNSNRNRYLMVLVDCFDRMTYLRGLRSTSGVDMAEALSDFFAAQGLWESIAIDSKCVTMGGLDAAILKKMGVKIIRSTYTSRHQGIVERRIRTSRLKILKFLNGEPTLSRWSMVLPVIEFAINSTPSCVLGWRSPHQMSLIRPPSLLLPPVEINGEKPSFKILAKQAEEVRMNSWRQLVGRKSFFRPDEALVRGQLVWKKRLSFNRNINFKLQSRVLEAYEILDRIATGLYRAKNVTTGSIIVVPSDQLIRCHLSLPEVKSIIEKLSD